MRSPDELVPRTLVFIDSYKFARAHSGSDSSTQADFWILIRRFSLLAAGWALRDCLRQAALAVTMFPVRSALISRIGGWPKNRLYSRLNWLTLS